MSQPRQDRAEPDWQVAYDETLLDPMGEAVLADIFVTTVENWPSPARVSFFFHELDVGRPLTTPFGEVPLPTPTPRPDRLSMLTYETP